MNNNLKRQYFYVFSGIGTESCFHCINFFSPLGKLAGRAIYFFSILNPANVVVFFAMINHIIYN